MGSFPHHVSIKDKYCCFYLGDAPEYVVALRLLKPQIEKKFPELKFYIGCKSGFKYLLEGVSNVVYADNPSKLKNDFAHIREIRNDHQKHSVLEFIEESITIEPICTSVDSNKGLCLICPEGLPPTRPMQVIDHWSNQIAAVGYAPLVLGSDVHTTLSNIKVRPSGDQKMNYIKEAAWVIGVENEYTMLAASQGKKVTLVDTGVGKSLFKKMFPKIQIVESSTKT